MSPGSAFVLPGLRTPFTKMDRELARYDGLALSAPVIQQTVAGDRGPGRDAAAGIDLVLWGAVIPSLTVSNWGREVWFDSGLDPAVPAQGIVQACATSLAAATHAAGQVGAGRADLVLCGGVESMSHTRIGLSQGLSRKIRRAGRAGSFPRMVRTLGGIRPRDLRISVPAVAERTTGKTMGEHAEEMAREWGIPREAQDRFAFASHEGATRNGGEFFRSLLVPPGTFPVDGDTLPRPGTSPEKLAGLRPRSPVRRGRSRPATRRRSPTGRRRAGSPRKRVCRRFRIPCPGPGWSTGGRRRSTRSGKGSSSHPRSRSRSCCTATGCRWTTSGCGRSTRRSPRRSCARWPRSRVRNGSRRARRRRTVSARSLGNASTRTGGSVALGHPFGATGARILSQTVVELASRPAGTRAIVSVCAAGVSATWRCWSPASSAAVRRSGPGAR